MKICGISFSDLNSGEFCDFLYDMDPKPNFWYVVLNKEKKKITPQHLLNNYRDLKTKLPKETKLILCISGEKIPPNDVLKRLGRVMKTEGADIVCVAPGIENGEVDKIKFSDVSLDGFLATRDVMDQLFDLYDVGNDLDASHIKILRIHSNSIRDI